MARDTSATIKVYEIDGSDTKLIDGPTIKVESHWNDGDRITLVVDGKRHTVIADDLEEAMQACKWSRY